MNEMIFNAIDDVVLESEFDTAYALAQGYLKAIAILESDDVTGEAEGFAIFQESGDDKDKKTKEDKKNEAKGGLINAIKRMFAAIAAKFKKSEESDPEKLDEKKKSILKKIGIAATVTTAFAGVTAILAKVSTNRTDAELAEAIRKMCGVDDEKAEAVKEALKSIEIKNGGKVYFKVDVDVAALDSWFKKFDEVLKHGGTNAEAVISASNDLYKVNKKEYSWSEFTKAANKVKNGCLADLKDKVEILNKKDAELANIDEATTLRLLRVFNDAYTMLWMKRVVATEKKITDAVFKLQYWDDDKKEAHGVVPNTTTKKVELASGEKTEKYDKHNIKTVSASNDGTKPKEYNTKV